MSLEIGRYHHCYLFKQSNRIWKILNTSVNFFSDVLFRGYTHSPNSSSVVSLWVPGCDEEAEAPLVTVVSS